MTILTFIETLIRVFTLSESFSISFPLWPLNKLNSMTLTTTGATRPFDGRVVGLSETKPHSSFGRSYMSPLDPELRGSLISELLGFGKLSYWALIDELSYVALDKLS